MNKFLSILSCATLTCSAFAQTAIYPADYVDVAEGPFNSPNLPLARGTSRVMCLYEDVDLDIPVGMNITKLGFREDGSLTTADSGAMLQLEVRMGWTTEDHTSMSTNFGNNYATTPVTVFGPAVYTLPDLRDPANPLPNGQFFIDLTTSFPYTPNGRNLLVEYRVFGTNGGGSQFNYRLDRADYYSPRTYGPAGCMHSGGQVPNLTIDRTRPGLSFIARATDGPANSPVFLVFNIGSSLTTPYPLGPIFNGVDPACTGQLAAGTVGIFGGSTSSGGNKNWSAQIPNDDMFGKLTISAQAVFLDFFTPGGVAVSRGGEVLTGIQPRTTILAAGGAPTSVSTGSKSTHYAPVAFFEYN